MKAGRLVDRVEPVARFGDDLDVFFIREEHAEAGARVAFCCCTRARARLASWRVAGVLRSTIGAIASAPTGSQSSAGSTGLFGYFASKLAAERVVADSDVPWTTLRATQFHDLILMTAQQLAWLPVIPVPAGFRFQPVDADEVAARLVELALGAPAGLVPDVAGPRVYGIAELLRAYLRPRGKHRLIVPVRLPGNAARAFRAGANLAPERAVGRRSWEEFLADRVSSSSNSRARPIGRYSSFV